MEWGRGISFIPFRFASLFLFFFLFFLSTAKTWDQLRHQIATKQPLDCDDDDDDDLWAVAVEDCDRVPFSECNEKERKTKALECSNPIRHRGRERERERAVR